MRLESETGLPETMARLRAEMAAREQTSAALAVKNAELYAEIQRRLAESESLSLIHI